MEPRFAFCTSSDGTRIAYATCGSGPPVLFVNSSLLSMDAQFSWPEARAFFDALAEYATLVIFDRRGSGASTRDVADLSFRAEVQDVLAVAEAAGLQTFPLFGDAAGGSAVCAAFAATHPEHVERLVLFAPWTSHGGHFSDAEAAGAFREDWTYGRRIWAGRLYPDGPVSLQRAASNAFKDSVSAEMAARRVEGNPDLLAIVPGVAQPALVLERHTGPLRRFAMQVVGLLPMGELRLVSGFGPTAYPDYEEILEETFEFLGIREGLGGGGRRNSRRPARPLSSSLTS